MSTRSVISSTELSKQIQQRFVDQSFEVTLVNSPNLEYEPGVTTDNTFLANQIPPGTYGYEPQVFRFEATDETNYTDGGVGLRTKTAVFGNDNTGSYQFTHVVLKRGQGNVVTVSGTNIKPTEGTTSTVVALPTVAPSGSTASGLTVDIEVTNDGQVLSDWVISVNSPGFGYEANDVITVLVTNLIEAGAAPATATGDLTFSVTEVNQSNGEIVSVTPAENTVLMDNGNEAVFYFDIKQFGFASQS